MVFLCSCGGLIWENRVHICGSVRCSCGGIKFDGRGHCCGYKPDYSVPPTDYELWRGFRSSDEWIGSTNWGKRSPSLFNTKNQETSILNSASAMEDMKSIKQTGSFQDYCTSFDFILTKVILSEDYATSLFVGGLKPEIRCWVEFLRPKTLEEAYEKAKNQANLLAIIESYKELKRDKDQILSNKEIQCDDFENRNEIQEACDNIVQETSNEEVIFERIGDEITGFMDDSIKSLKENNNNNCLTCSSIVPLDYSQQAISGWENRTRYHTMGTFDEDSIKYVVACKNQVYEQVQDTIDSEKEIIFYASYTGAIYKALSTKKTKHIWHKWKSKICYKVTAPSYAINKNLVFCIKEFTIVDTQRKLKLTQNRLQGVAHSYAIKDFEGSVNYGVSLVEEKKNEYTKYKYGILPVKWKGLSYRKACKGSISPNEKQELVNHCKFQSKTDTISEFICDSIIRAMHYQSGIPPEDQRRTQDLLWWHNGLVIDNFGWKPGWKMIFGDKNLLRGE